MTRRALLLLPLAAALAPCPASAADTVVAQLARPSKIRTYAGVQVFSVFDGGAYRLTVRRDGKVQPLAVAPSRAPFDVDIGPDSRGRPQLIYTRCAVEIPSDGGANRNRGCDLYALSLAGGRERPVRAANTPANEFAPTLWKGRIAFARALEGRDGPIVYITRPGATRLRRVPGVPQRARGQRVTEASVDELELRGDRLAQIVSFVARGRLSDVRLANVSGHASRRLARVGVGEGGQYFADLGFADGYLAWAFSWVAGGGELVPGIYRLRLSTGRLSRADSSSLLRFGVVGLAPFAADGAYMTEADLPSDDGCGGAEAAPTAVVGVCRVVRASPLHFAFVQDARAGAA